jgi:hypothetical protein
MDLAKITASIRVDDITQKGSVIDVVRLVNPNLTSSNASNTCTVAQVPVVRAKCVSLVDPPELKFVIFFAFFFFFF